MLHIRERIVVVMKKFLPLLIGLGFPEALGVIFQSVPLDQEKAVQSQALRTSWAFCGGQTGGLPRRKPALKVEDLLLTGRKKSRLALSSAWTHHAIKHHSL